MFIENIFSRIRRAALEALKITGILLSVIALVGFMALFILMIESQPLWCIGLGIVGLIFVTTFVVTLTAGPLE